MGPFKDAVAAGRKAVTKEREQKKADADAKAAATKADIEAGRSGWMRMSDQLSMQPMMI